MRPALFYEKAADGAVKCLLCPHACIIPRDKSGRCLARRNKDGELYAESFGRITSVALDPIEKKPLHHFFPGSKILSLGSYGCNFHCAFCQNHEISMRAAEFRSMEPSDVAALSLDLRSQGNIGVAYTYNEPLISFEFVQECATLLHRQGQKNVLVTNGFINPEPLLALLPLIDAMNIDLKSFSPLFYQELGGNPETVKATIAAAAKACHVEVTTLVVPGKNDTVQEMEALAAWLGQIDRTITLHLSRFFPRYQMTDLPATPLETLHTLAQTAKKHLQNVHLGNC